MAKGAVGSGKMTPLVWKIKALNFSFLIGTVLGFIIGSWTWLIVGFVVCFLFESFIGNGYAHRYYGHKTYKPRPWLKPILDFLVHYQGFGSILTWKAYHRRHHEYSDTELDSHSPQHGWIYILSGAWGQLPRDYYKEQLRDSRLVWYHKHYFKMHLAIALFWIGLGSYISGGLNLNLWIFLYCFPGLYGVISAYVLIFGPHVDGEPVDRWWLDFYTFGEGNHLYHHEYPWSYRNGKYDITGWIIENLLMVPNPEKAKKVRRSWIEHWGYENGYGNNYKKSS